MIWADPHYWGIHACKALISSGSMELAEDSTLFPAAVAWLLYECMNNQPGEA